VFTFGAGMYGQLGHGQIGHEYLPRKIPDLMGSQVTQIACGRCHTLVYLASNRRLYSFGLGGNGQLGIASCANNTSPNYVHVELANVKNNLEVGAESKLSQLSLFTISAGGDQSFIAYNKVSGKTQPLLFPPPC
jgi:alpha-tubulin suppressor-like RCC1 family protein